MYKIPEFIVPEHLKDLSDFNINLQRILELYPPDIGTEVGGWVYDFSAPIAALEEELAVYHIPEVMKQMFVFWASDIYLDAQAIVRRLTRNKATFASGEVQITTNKEVTIPKGFVLATAATDYNFSKKYEVIEEAVINGTGKVKVQALVSGVDGNTLEDTVIIQEKTLDGITKVTNPLPIDGGVDTEDDEHLRQRLIEYDLHYHKSFIGNVFDYRMWAMDVDGVGIADVLAATINDGVVTIVLTDMNGEPANEELIDRVRLHIMGKHQNDMKRLAPVNAKLKIIPIEVYTVNIVADVKLELGHNIEVVKEDYIKALKEYFKEAKLEKVVRYSEVGGALIDTLGVDDYLNLKLNDGIKNIELTNIQMAKVGAVTLNVI